MRILKNILVLSVPTIIFLFLLLEIFFRIVIPSSDPPRGFFDTNEKIYSYSNDKKEGIQTIGKFAEIKTRWRINNMGWNYPVNYYPVKNKKLIAVIGDSYVEAFQVDVDKNYPYLLRERLGSNFEVFAFGMSGASLAQYLNMSRYINKHLNPDILIFNITHNDFDESIKELSTERYYFLQVSLINDSTFTEITPRPDYSFAQYSPFKRLLYKSAFIRYLRHNLKIKESLKDIYSGKKGNYEGNINPVKVKENEKKIFSATDYLIRTIIDENPGKRIIFIIDGPRKAIYNSELNISGIRWVNKILETLCKTYNIEYIDLTYPMEKDFKDNGIKFNSELDFHWNEYGHKFVANVLFDYLKNK